MSALKQSDLSDASCVVDEQEVPDVLYLHGACHPSAGTRVRYEKKTGVLTVACRECRKFIAAFQVAP